MCIENYLKENIRYDPETGELWWCKQKARGNKRDLTKPVGVVGSHGYKTFGLRLGGKSYTLLNHRVAWLLQKGIWPEEMIDHADRDKLNNSWGNLRQASNKKNLYNSHKRVNTSSKYKGVSWHKTFKKWVARGKSPEGTQVFLGYYLDEAEAAKAYNDHAEATYGEYSKLNEVH